MAYTNTTPNYRVRYAPWVDPLPEENTLAEEFEFSPRQQMQGGQYRFPVLVSEEQGITLNNDGSAFSTNSAIDAVILEAQVDGSEIAGVADMSANELSRSSNGASNGAGGSAAPAYFEIPDLKMKNIQKMCSRTREVQLAWGAGTASTVAADIGVISAIISGANLAAPIVASITRASWIAGLWPQMQNALVDILQTDGVTSRDTSVTMLTVTDVTKNRLKLFKTASAVLPTANDRLVLVGAKAKSCYGIQAISENAGTLFNIDALANIVWRVTQYTSVGAPTRAKIQLLASRLLPYGVTKGGTLFCASAMLADLIEEADLTHHFETVGNDLAPKVKRQGSSALVYTTPIGDIKVVAHKYWKQGFAFFHANRSDEGGKCGVRIGSTDLTMDEKRGGMMFRALEGSMGARIRMYSHQAPILTVPWHCAWLSGITSNADSLPS